MVECHASPKTVKRYLELSELRRKAAPRLFRRTWRCELADCNGQPHEDRDFKHARSEQVIGDEHRIFYLVGGRGSGKTWAGSRNFGQLILDTEPEPGHDHTEWAVIGPTYRDTRDTLIEGPSGLIRALGGYGSEGGFVEKWDRSFGHLYLTTGAFIYADSANDGGQRIQGKDLYGAWCDEIGLWKSWRRAWSESLLFAVRQGQARIICTGTPKRSSLAKELLDDASVGRRRLRTVDNLANLAQKAVDWLLARYKDTTLGQQELEGILVDDVEGALWKRANIDADRLELVVTDSGANAWQDHDGNLHERIAHFDTVVIALDPADGLEDGDEQGLCELAQRSGSPDLYVLESDGLRLTPWDFLCHSVDRALTYDPPALLVVEKNHGAGYLLGLLDQVIAHKEAPVKYRIVNAGDSKRTRAEQVAGLYEQHKVHHVGHFTDLEDQMCTWTGLGNEPSPDRMDALVWALTHFATPQPKGARMTFAGRAA